MIKFKTSFFFLHFVFIFTNVLSQNFDSVQDLENFMYENVEGNACIRSITVNGEKGCANPGVKPVSSPLIRIENASVEISKNYAILLPPQIFQTFLLRVLNDTELSTKVAGILVEYSNGTDINGFSPADKFPQSEFASYANKSYVWNKIGSSISEKNIPFPIFSLSINSTKLLKEKARINEEKNFEFPLFVVEFNLIMQTTISHTNDSESCLENLTCLPLGGYSIFSSLPPINVSKSTNFDKKIILVISSIDSSSFFRDLSPGADSPLSGTIALLGAVDAISKISNLNSLSYQLVFLVLTGESKGYLGSRKFLSEINSKNNTYGFQLSDIHQIIEIGSIGKAIQENNFIFHAHFDTNHASSSVNELLDIMKNISSEMDNFVILEADESNPGIPPSSLMSFLNYNASLPGIVLEEFDSNFKNNFYSSQYDNLENMNASAISAASTFLSRVLLSCMGGNYSEASSLSANQSLIEELGGCLLSSSPGMTCGAVSSLITPQLTRANHYVGVVLGIPSDNPDPSSVDDTSRFVFNFMADRTGDWARNYAIKDGGNYAVQETCSLECNSSEFVCVGSRKDTKGRCVFSNTRYLPTYSPRLQHDGVSWKILALTNESNFMDAVDPVWCESFWHTISTKLYLKDSGALENSIFISGVFTLIASIVVSYYARAYAVKHLSVS